MAAPAYATTGETIWYYSFRIICALIFLFLIAPVLVIIPLSFNAEPYFSFSEGMLALDPDAYSLRWYRDIVENEQWSHSFWNSAKFGLLSTILATTLGTLAALGLSRPNMPYKGVIMGILISPMIVPLIISAAGMFFFYSYIGISQTDIGIIIGHTILGTPFVVITVTATLVGFDHSLIRAGLNLGATPQRVFFKIIMPLILPGVISGALFAFITSLDEVVLILFLADFEQRTIPKQMWQGLREQISPTILAVATLLITLSIILLTVLELLRRRNERLRGMTAG